MKKLTLTILALLLTTVANAKDVCETHPIYCSILKVKPSINRTFAMELSNYIYKYSQRYGTDPTHSVAIAMQESSLINRDRKETVIDKRGNVVRGVSDVGVFQLHVDTIKNMRESQGWDINFDRLRSDVEYQTYWHIRLLKRKIRICSSKREKLRVTPGNEWSCYHSYTYKRRQIYLEDVSVHLEKIQTSRNLSDKPF